MNLSRLFFSCIVNRFIISVQTKSGYVIRGIISHFLFRTCLCYLVIAEYHICLVLGVFLWYVYVVWCLGVIITRKRSILFFCTLQNWSCFSMMDQVSLLFYEYFLYSWLIYCFSQAYNFTCKQFYLDFCFNIFGGQHWLPLFLYCLPHGIYLDSQMCQNCDSLIRHLTFFLYFSCYSLLVVFMLYSYCSCCILIVFFLLFLCQFLHLR